MVSTNFKARTRQDFVVALGSMFLALVMILSLTSCSKEKGAQSSEQLFELHTYTQLKAESLSAVPDLCENNFFTMNGRTTTLIVGFLILPVVRKFYHYFLPIFFHNILYLLFFHME